MTAEAVSGPPTFAGPPPKVTAATRATAATARDARRPDARAASGGRPAGGGRVRGARRRRHRFGDGRCGPGGAQAGVEIVVQGVVHRACSMECGCREFGAETSAGPGGAHAECGGRDAQGLRGVGAGEVEPGGEDHGLAVERRERQQRRAQRGVGDLLGRIGDVDVPLDAEQGAQRGEAALAAALVREDAARDAEQPAERRVARDVALAAPRDGVRLGDDVVGVGRRRHRPRVGAHPGVRRSEEVVEVHAGHVSGYSTIATGPAVRVTASRRSARCRRTRRR